MPPVRGLCPFDLQVSDPPGGIAPIHFYGATGGAQPRLTSGGEAEASEAPARWELGLASRTGFHLGGGSRSEGDAGALVGRFDFKNGISHRAAKPRRAIRRLVGSS